MLTHFGNFLCSLGGKEPFKTDTSLRSAALEGAFSAKRLDDFFHFGEFFFYVFCQHKLVLCPVKVLLGVRNSEIPVAVQIVGEESHG